MSRTLVLLVCVFCVGTVITEAIGIGVLVMRGQLTAETWRDIRSVLSGTPLGSQTIEVETTDTQPSSEQIMQQRVRSILQLNTREEELDRFRIMIDTLASELSQEKEQFRLQKLAFQKELQQAEEQLTAESTEQARGILGKLRPDDATASLMALTLNENVVILRGMPERSIGRILESFSKSGDPALAERGQQIFEAISRGEPRRALLSGYQEQAGAAAPADAALPVRE